MYTLDHDLRLRPIVLPDDVAAAVLWYQDPEVLYYSEGGESSSPYDDEKVRTMYQYLTDRAEVFIIEAETANGWLPIGDVALFRDIGVPIVIGHPDYRSKGIGKRVIQWMVARARKMGRKEITTNGIYTFNERSRRLFESVGFQMIEQFHDDDGNECVRYRLIL